MLFSKFIFALKIALGIYKRNCPNVCPFCLEIQQEPFAKKREGFIIITLVKCLKCNLVFQSPRMEEEDLRKFYSREYRKLKSSSVTENQFQRGRRRGNQYLETLGNWKVDVTQFRVLEIGSALGGILEAFKEQNATVHGVEWDIDCIKFSNYKNIHTTANLEELKNTRFDLIVLSHLLEHVSTPVQFLKNLIPYLSENGRIFVVVPGLKEESLPSNIQIGHLFYFDEKTLEFAMTSAGYEKVQSNPLIEALYKVKKS